MEQFLFIFVLIPLIGALLITLIPKANEKLLSQAAFSTMGIQFVSVFFYTIVWIWKGAPTFYTKELVLFYARDYELFIDYAYNNVTAVFLLTGAFIAFLITAYSRNYLHRESGYKRFFNTIMFFYLGFNVIVLSGNLTSIFIGWEISGIASFLLIAYYRNRYLPVKNAVKIFSIYRLGDISLILAMWISHHLWHKNISLMQLSDTASVMDITSNYTMAATAFSLLIVLAAMIKSAQFPFSAWLPRAMEGPTPSSAIFYTSLSVHMGLLLLMRTYPFWEHLGIVKLVIIIIGLVTFVITGITAQVQPTIKGQIAYSTTSQIGLMFVEVALGWHTFVLFHFTAHALFRSYQLLISPSVVTYLIREQFYSYVPKIQTKFNPAIQNFMYSIYILSLVEWYMDVLMHQLMWNVFKTLGKKLQLFKKWFYVFSVLLVVSIFFMLFYKRDILSFDIVYYSQVVILVLALVYSLQSFTEKKNVQLAWLSLLINHVFIVLAISLYVIEPFYVELYLSGIVIAYILGFIVLRILKKSEDNVSLVTYQGHCYEHPRLDVLFLLASMAMFGFPITTAFLGIELFYGYIHLDHFAIVVLVSLSYVVNSLSVIRMYARVFLGPHVKTYHVSARKST